jgi:hypothetical protein
VDGIIRDRTEGMRHVRGKITRTIVGAEGLTQSLSACGGVGTMWDKGISRLCSVAKLSHVNAPVTRAPLIICQQSHFPCPLRGRSAGARRSSAVTLGEREPAQNSIGAG